MYPSGLSPTFNRNGFPLNLVTELPTLKTAEKIYLRFVMGHFKANFILNSNLSHPFSEYISNGLLDWSKGESNMDTRSLRRENRTRGLSITKYHTRSSTAMSYSLFQGHPKAGSEDALVRRLQPGSPHDYETFRRPVYVIRKQRLCCLLWSSLRQWK